MPGRIKQGPGRDYDAGQLALYAEYQERRVPYRPAECKPGVACWVKEGPPAMSPGGVCHGCGGTPRGFVWRAGRYPKP